MSQAHGGTLFLDEIGDSLLSFQIKLLRVLQEKQVRRIGDDKLIPVDVRVIVATNKDIAQLVRERSFREDLYYRLNVLPLHLAAAAGAPRRYPSACQRVLPRDGVFTAEAFAV